jgi:hypothetical protein
MQLLLYYNDLSFIILVRFRLSCDTHMMKRWGFWFLALPYSSEQEGEE